MPTSDGVSIVKILSWKYFLDFVYQQMLNYETYIWRGQRNEDWELDSTLDRLIMSAKIARTKQYDFRQAHLEQFKFAARGRRGANPTNIDTENEWWALGQHHGLATPLLDWTSSPFVGAYFSYIGLGNPQTRSRAIYALHKPSIESKAYQIVKAKEAENRQQRADIDSGKKASNAFARMLLDNPVMPQVEFIRPMSDENQRLVNQGGLFTRTPDGQTIENWVRANFLGENKCILLKILIPNKDRSECLKTLNRMNINHLTLFPDLYGASKFCNLYGEVEKY